jgi:hypothetical protein
LFALFLIWCLVPPVVSSVCQANRHRPRVSQNEARETAERIVAQDFPEFTDSAPVIHETEFDRDRGYRIVYTASDAVETELGSGESIRVLVISVNAVTEEVSVAISQ